MHKVLIVSYETLRKVAGQLEGVADLMVCDEGHRLKAAAGNKTIDALAGLGCKRHILLTGTPLQNNLEELYGAAYHAIRYAQIQHMPASVGGDTSYTSLWLNTSLLICGVIS